MLTFKQFINESIEDKGIFKAIFMGGTPGAGKSFVLGKIKSGQIEPRIVNTDKGLEFLAGKHGVKLTSEYNDAFLDRAEQLNHKMLAQYVNGMLPLWIDGTSSKASSLFRRVGVLESLGYDYGMIWVNTDLETAIKRAKQRDRQVPEQVIREIHQQAEQNKQYYQSKFSNFWEIDNNEGMLTDQVIRKAYAQVTNFYTSEIKNPIGQRIVEQAKQEGYKYLSPHIYDFDVIMRYTSMWYTSTTQG